MSWTEDARYIGIALGANKWDIALRIARSVLPASADNAVHGEYGAFKTAAGDDHQRVPQHTFAKRAKVGHQTVKRWYLAWELAADDGVVDHAADLLPDTEYHWNGMGDFAHYISEVGKIDRWLRAKSQWEKEVAQRNEDDLRAILGGAKTAAEVEAAVAAEAENPGSIRQSIPGIEDESKRRDAIRALQHGAKALHDQWNQLVAEHTHTGVADEVAWLHDTSSHLTEIQWGIGAFIVEDAKAERDA